MKEELVFTIPELLQAARAIQEICKANAEDYCWECPFCKVEQTQYVREALCRFMTDKNAETHPEHWGLEQED